MASPAEMARRNAEYAQAAGVAPHVRATIERGAIANQESILPIPYYSAVRFRSAAAAGPPATQTIDTTERNAFAYGVGGVMDGAGFIAGTIATQAETNLKVASTTNDNSQVDFYGIALELGPTSDPLLTQLVFENTDLTMSLNGSQVYRLGRLAFYPAGMGLYGVQTSLLEPAPTYGTVATPEGFLSNGNPDSNAIYGWPEGLHFVWEAIGGGARDSALVMTFTPRRNLVFTSRRVARVAVAGGAGTSGTEAWDLPAAGALGTWVQIVVRLISIQTSKRSTNT